MRTERLDDGVVRSEGPNGLIVVTETMPALRSAAAGFWIRAKRPEAYARVAESATEGGPAATDRAVGVATATAA